MNEHNCIEYDIIIIGAGLVGASLALALSKNFKIAVLDKLPSPVEKNLENCDQARALALSYPSVKYLESLCPSLKSSFLFSENPIKEVHVSVQNKWGVTRIKAEDYALAFLGTVINADILNQHLSTALVAESLASDSSITVFRPVEIQTIQQDHQGHAEQHCKIKLNTGLQLSAKLLVAADGSDSFLRQYYGIGLQTYDYSQTAIVANVALSQATGATAFERFTQQGSLALLPFGNKKMKCVWVLPKEIAATQMQSRELEFLDQLQAEFGYRLGRFDSLYKRVSYPLKNLRTESLYGHRFVFVGNAAHTLHPIAAQGFNLGLRDVAVLQDILYAAHKRKKDIGNIEILKNYVAQRKRDHNTTQHFCHFLANAAAMPIMHFLPSANFGFLAPWLVQQAFGRS